MIGGVRGEIKTTGLWYLCLELDGLYNFHPSFREVGAPADRDGCLVADSVLEAWSRRLANPPGGNNFQTQLSSFREIWYALLTYIQLRSTILMVCATNCETSSCCAVKFVSHSGGTTLSVSSGHRGAGTG